PTADMMPTGSEHLWASTARGRTSHRDGTEKTHSVSARICTALATWSSGSSTRSSIVGVWQRVTTNSRPTTSHSSSLRPYAYGCALMSPRPSTTLADFSQARDSQITFSVTHGWSAFWRGRPWLAGRRIGETSSDVGSSRFWIGWVTKHGD